MKLEEILTFSLIFIMYNKCVKILFIFGYIKIINVWLWQNILPTNFVKI